jgi:hypothetical protein
VKEFLEKIPQDDIVCVIDAYDVLMLQHVDILKDKFIKQTENTDYKLICAIDPLPVNPLSNWYYGIEKEQNIIINAGTYIGFSGFIHSMYKNMIELYNLNNLLSDDQFLLNKFYINHKNEILIDKNNKFFLCEASDNIFHIKKRTDDFVFIHRPMNYEMISVLIQNCYKIDLNEMIAVSTNELKSLIKKGSNHLIHAAELTKTKLNKK